MTGKARDSSPEAELIVALKNGSLGSKDEALRVLALMMSSGRLKRPSEVATEPRKDGIASF